MRRVCYHPQFLIHAQEHAVHCKGGRGRSVQKSPQVSCTQDSIPPSLSFFNKFSSLSFKAGHPGCLRWVTGPAIHICVGCSIGSFFVVVEVKVMGRLDMTQTWVKNFPVFLLNFPILWCCFSGLSLEQLNIFIITHRPIIMINLSNSATGYLVAFSYVNYQFKCVSY